MGYNRTVYKYVYAINAIKKPPAVTGGSNVYLNKTDTN